MHVFPGRPDKTKGKVCVLGSYRRCSLVSNGRRYLLNMLGQPVRFLCSVHTRKGQSIKPKWLLVGEAFFDQKLLTCRTLDVKSFYKIGQFVVMVFLSSHVWIFSMFQCCSSVSNDPTDASMSFEAVDWMLLWSFDWTSGGICLQSSPSLGFAWALPGQCCAVQSKIQ